MFITLRSWMLLPLFLLAAWPSGWHASTNVATATSDQASSAGLQQVFEKNKDSTEYEQDLSDLVAFASVSALPQHAHDLLAAAEWLKGRLTAAGLQSAQVLPTEGPQPVVYAEWKAPEGGRGRAGEAASNGTRRLTVLVYGHYDVQPVDPLEEWESEPFKVSKRDGYFYGRGVDDDKGGLLQPIQAVEAWLAAAGHLPVDVKFLLEGQEEVMSPHLEQFLAKHRDLLSADLVLSADGGQPAADKGGISLGLRGIVGLQLEVATAGTDMHSGMKGGSVPNPNRVLAALLADMHDPATHEVLVPGFYEGVSEPTEQDIEDIEAYGFDEQKELEALGLMGFVGEQGYCVLEQRWLRPSLEVVGMSGGFTGEGIKTVIPRSAFAKLSARLVPGQTPDDIFAKVSAFVAEQCPEYARCSVSRLGGSAMPWVNPRDTPGNRAVARVLQRVMGAPPVYLRDGATIPALASFQQILGLHTSKFGWGLGDKIHAPNERLREDMYRKGRLAWAELLHELGTLGGEDGKGAPGHEEAKHEEL